MSDLLHPHGLQHVGLPGTLLSPRVCSNSCPLSQWCHSTVLSFVSPFSTRPQSSQHQGLFQWVGSLHQVAKVLKHQSLLRQVLHQDLCIIFWIFNSWNSLFHKSMLVISFSLCLIPDLLSTSALRWKGETRMY